MHVVGLGEGRDVEALEQGQDRERGESLRRRRKAGGLSAPVGNAQRLDPLGLVPSEVVGRQRTAGGARAPREPPGERAPVECVASAPSDLFEGRREIGLHEALAPQKVGMEDAPEPVAEIDGRLVAEEIRGVGGFAALARRRGKPVARVDDGRLEQRAPRDRRGQRVAAQHVGRPPTRHDAGHGQRRGPAAHGNRRAEAGAIGREVGGGARPAGGVQRAKRPVASVVDQPEAVAADPVHVRVDDGDSGARGDGGVHRVAAPLEDRQSSLGGQRMGCGHEPA